MTSPKTINQAFEQFEREIVRVSDADNADAKSVHPEIRDHLKHELPTVGDFLSGSYGRKTKTSPLKDVDLILILDDRDGKLRLSAKDGLERVRSVLTDSPLVERTRLGVRAVKAQLGDYDFHFDVVPALENEGSGELSLPRCLPDENLDDWTLEHPRGQLQAAIDRNAETDGFYIRLIRVMKFWNAGVESNRLSSYHVEAIAHQAIMEKLSWPEAVVAWFDRAYDVLAPGVFLPDPGNPTRDVLERLDADKRAKRRGRVERDRDLARKAAEIDDLDEALRAWAKVFGPSFPMSDADRKAAEHSLSTGEKVAIGVLGAAAVGAVIKSRSWRPA
jgi:hypothetical protein